MLWRAGTQQAAMPTNARTAVTAAKAAAVSNSVLALASMAIRRWRRRRVLAPLVVVRLAEPCIAPRPSARAAQGRRSTHAVAR